MLNPKVISEVAVLIHDIIVVSYELRVRSNASLVESSGAGALRAVWSVI
jgi:hypothetical protein